MALVDEHRALPDFHILVKVQKGDIRFINKFRVTNSRSAWEDYPQPTLRRDLGPTVVDFRS